MTLSLDPRRLGVIVLVVCACRSSEQKGPPASPVVVPTPTLAALSVWAERGGRCEWFRVDPLVTGTSETLIHRTSNPCRSTSLAWNERATRAVLDVEERIGHRLFDYSVRDGSIREIPLPPGGELVRIGFDRDDSISAFTTLSWQTSGMLGQVAERFGIPSGECTPGNVRKQRFQGERWVAEGEKELDCKEPVRLALSLFEVDHPIRADAPIRSELSGEPIADQRIRKIVTELDRSLPQPVATATPPPRYLPRDAPDDWVGGKVPGGGAIAVRQGRIILIDSNAAAYLPPDAPPDGRGAARGGYLLLVDERASAARLYEVATRRMLYRSDAIYHATFWPVARE